MVISTSARRQVAALVAGGILALTVAGCGGDSGGAAAEPEAQDSMGREDHIAAMRDANDNLADSTDTEVEEEAETYCSQMEEMGVETYMNGVTAATGSDGEVLRAAVLPAVTWKCANLEQDLQDWEPTDS